MKRVTFEIAKAIKDIGYPQGNTYKCYLTADYTQFYKEGRIVDNTDGEWTVLTKNLADRPTYLDVWLWLWREKHIAVEADYSFANDDWFDGGICGKKFNDPEEAIIAAIEYLFNNDLIK